MYSRSCGSAFSIRKSSHVPVRAVLGAAARRSSSGAHYRAPPPSAASPGESQSRSRTAPKAGSFKMGDVRRTIPILAFRATAAPNGLQQTVGCCEISFGMTPAPTLAKSYPPGSPERLMHGGVPIEPNDDHVMIAVCNRATGTRVTNASVVAEVWTRDLRDVPVKRKALQPMMSAGDMIYGNYFHMPTKANYDIKGYSSLPDASTPGTTLRYENWDRLRAEYALTERVGELSASMMSHDRVLPETLPGHSLCCGP